MCKLLPAGETAIPVTFAKYLFRTPSLGGQDSGLAADLPVIFLCLLRPHCGARRIAHLVSCDENRLRGTLAVSSLLSSGIEPKKGWAECNVQESGWLWHSLAGWRHVATRRANRPSSVVPSVRAPRRYSTATSSRVRPLAWRAMCSTASNIQAAADPRHRGLTGSDPGTFTLQTTRTVRRHCFARSLSRCSLPKTKDVPCSRRS